LDQCLPMHLGQSPENSPLILDLSLLQTIDYYTGIVFEVVSDAGCVPRSDGTSERQHAPAQAQILGQGGRYDQLLELYHPQGNTIPGIGFALNIEDLHQVLLSTNQLPQQTPASNWLVVPESQQAYSVAFAYAEKLRNSLHLVRVEMDLGGRDPDAIREYARHRGIHQIAWLKAEGLPIIEPLTETRSFSLL